jgi:hypothetical protein
MVRVIVEEDGGLERGQPIRFVLEYNGELKIAVVKTDMMKKFQLEMEGEEFSGLCFEDYFEGEPGDEVRYILTISFFRPSTHGHSPLTIQLLVTHFHLDLGCFLPLYSSTLSCRS